MKLKDADRKDWKLLKLMTPILTTGLFGCASKTGEMYFKICFSALISPINGAAGILLINLHRNWDTENLLKENKILLITQQKIHNLLWKLTRKVLRLMFIFNWLKLMGECSEIKYTLLSKLKNICYCVFSD